MEPNATHRILYQESRPLLKEAGQLTARLSKWEVGVIKVLTLHLEVTAIEGTIIAERHEVVDKIFDDALAQRYAIESFDKWHGYAWYDDEPRRLSPARIRTDFRFEEIIG